MFHYNPDNKILQMLSLYFDLIVLAALWEVTSALIVTAGVSTTALYQVLFKMTREDNVSGVARAFFGCWRNEWKRSTLLWGLLSGLLLLIGGDLYVCIAYRPEGPVGLTLWAGTFLAAMLALCLLVYVFPINARFDCTARQIFGNAVRFTAGNLGQTLALIGLLVLMGVSVFLLQALSPLVVGPLLYASVKQLNTIFEPVTACYENGPEKRETDWTNRAADKNA